MGAEEVIVLFNRLADAVQSKIPVWLVMMEMTVEEIAALERFVIRCENMSFLSEDLWKGSENEKQWMVCEMLKQAHRGH